MEKVIKKLYTVFYQKTTGITYREQILVTATTVSFMLAIIIPLISLFILNNYD